MQWVLVECTEVLNQSPTAPPSPEGSRFVWGTTDILDNDGRKIRGCLKFRMDTLLFPRHFCDTTQLKLMLSSSTFGGLVLLNIILPLATDGQVGTAAVDHILELIYVNTLLDAVVRWSGIA